MDALQPDDPRELGSYRMLKTLGARGMGRVYLARSPGGRTVAVKVVRPDLAADADFRGRFRHEVEIARAVSGRYTAPVVDADPDVPLPWLATSYVLGPDLTDVVAAHGALPERTVRALAAGLAAALQEIHAAGLIHRDLKPVQRAAGRRRPACHRLRHRAGGGRKPYDADGSCGGVSRLHVAGAGSLFGRDARYRGRRLLTGRRCSPSRQPDAAPSEMALSRTPRCCTRSCTGNRTSTAYRSP